MKSNYVDNFIKKWKILVPVWIFIWIVLACIQIYILEKDTVFSVFHGFLISSLISL